MEGPKRIDDKERRAFLARLQDEFARRERRARALERAAGQRGSPADPA